jgi:hypothetical protein
MPVLNLPITETAVESPTTTMTSDGMDRRKQPWKAHWPPKKGAAAGAPYGFEKGQTIVIFGN